MMKNQLKKSLVALSLVSLSAVSIADDTDIIDVEFYGGSNILFVMDMSGSMKWEMDSDTDAVAPIESRKTILHNALIAVLNDPTLTDINIGISSFSGKDSSGNSTPKANGITFPVSPIDSDADAILNSNSSFTHKGTSYLPIATVGSSAVSISTRGYISNSVPQTWIPAAGTPIVDALYEAALYFRGSVVDWGNYDPSDIRSAHPSTYTGTFGGATPTYNSPIKHECSNNAIVLLSDGRPTANSAAASVQSLIGGSCDTGTDNGRCGKELTKFLATNDNSGLPNDQYIKTHVIGVGLNLATNNGRAADRYMRDLATNGGGEFVNATTAEGLAKSLKDTVTLVSKARSFVSPTYTPNLSSLLTHSNDVYIPVFDRGIGPVWPGNLKKFKRENGKLMDADGHEALDANGGLKDTARDFWSAVPSVHSIKSGGAANKLLGSSSRKVYTDAGKTAPFWLQSNNLKESNAVITAALLGDPAMTATHRIELIEFIRGDRSDKTPRHHMGDIIHSKPVHLAYGSNSSDRVLFFGTNEGYLHAINDNDGTEEFAFMPEELLGGIKTQFENAASKQHLYGVDGPITVRHDDDNHNRIVDNGEKAYLYFGLRRGGKSYYAIDVSDRVKPRLLWKIDTATTDLSKLGFTWSQPVQAKLKDHGTLKDVLVFGGGFIDDSSTSSDVNGDGSMAAEVYIVDASDGHVIWNTSKSAPPSAAAKYAVPGGIRVLDVNRNGSLDRLYFGDTGGNIWRVDFEDDYTAVGDAKVMYFADLGDVSLPATTKRKFFTEPDLALFKYKGKYLMSISVGSGDRPNPLGLAGDDHFFVMFDDSPLKTPATTPAIITKAKLANATLGPVSNALSGTNKGWYMDLVTVDGEKILSDALTYNNMVMFSSLGATEITITACGIKSNTHPKLYVLDLLTGGAVLDLDKDGSVSPGSGGDRYIGLPPGDIPGAPQVVFKDLTRDDGTSACVRGDCVRPEAITSGGKSIGGNTSNLTLPAPNKSLRKVFWLDKEK